MMFKIPLLSVDPSSQHVESLRLCGPLGPRSVGMASGGRFDGCTTSKKVDPP